MGTNTLSARATSNTIEAADVNQYRTCFIGDLVPRDATGAPTNDGGAVGSSSYRFSDIYLAAGALISGASTLSFSPASGSAVLLPNKTAGATDSTVVVGDDIAVSTASGRSKMTIGNTSGRSELHIGQSATAALQISWLYNATAGSAEARIFCQGGTNNILLQDAGGNLGLGVAAGAFPAWATASTVLQIAGNCAIRAKTAIGASSYLNVTNNAVNDGAWKYISTDQASRYDQLDGEHYFYVVASGTAGNAITWAPVLTLENGATVKVASLAGSGSRTVVADANGVLSAP